MTIDDIALGIREQVLDDEDFRAFWDFSYDSTPKHDDYTIVFVMILNAV